jgi:hypothetical protein
MYVNAINVTISEPKNTFTSTTVPTGKIEQVGKSVNTRFNNQYW